MWGPKDNSGFGSLLPPFHRFQGSNSVSSLGLCGKNLQPLTPLASQHSVTLRDHFLLFYTHPSVRPTEQFHGTNQCAPHTSALTQGPFYLDSGKKLVASQAAQFIARIHSFRVSLPVHLAILVTLSTARQSMPCHQELSRLHRVTSAFLRNPGESPAQPGTPLLNMACY